MSDTTPNRGYPFPESTDAPRIYEDIQDLANAIDADVDNLFATYGVVARITTGTNGTTVPSSGGGETKDAVLGDISFTSPGGIRYRVTLDGRGVSGSVIGDTFTCGVRNGGASSPTTGSTLVDHVTKTPPVEVTGTGGSGCIHHSATFLPAAGVVTLAAFWARINGSGSGIPVGQCELVVEAIGTI